MGQMVEKGTRVLVQEKETYLPCLSGMQMKFGLRIREFTGIVRHVRSDHPTSPTKIHLWISPDDNPENLGKFCERCQTHEIEVDQKSIAAILESDDKEVSDHS